jgi:hypothetical protein
MVLDDAHFGTMRMTMVILENGGIFAAAFSVVVAETLCDFIF